MVIYIQKLGEKTMICCFTGHRSIPPEYMKELPYVLDYQIERLIVCGVTQFRGGGAIGFDTLAELVVLEKKEKYDFLRLDLILPCRDQTAKWSARDKQIYDYILARADSVRYVSDKYTSGCMYARNRALVDGSDFCLTFCSSDKGGTAYTVDYARSRDVDVINTLELMK